MEATRMLGSLGKMDLRDLEAEEMLKIKQVRCPCAVLLAGAFVFSKNAPGC